MAWNTIHIMYKFKFIIYKHVKWLHDKATENYGTHYPHWYSANNRTSEVKNKKQKQKENTWLKMIIIKLQLLQTGTAVVRKLYNRYDCLSLTPYPSYHNLFHLYDLAYWKKMLSYNVTDIKNIFLETRWFRPRNPKSINCRCGHSPQNGYYSWSFRMG